MPNVLQWFRYEQMGQGFSARLFYNEVPVTNGIKSWWNHGGHMLVDHNDENELNKKLHSFTHANQDTHIRCGLDTTTPEGRKAFQEEFEALREMCPEVMGDEEIVFPHEMQPKLTNEPHFRRMWNHYRMHHFRLAVAHAQQEGKLAAEDVSAMNRFLGMNSAPSFSLYVMARNGQLPHMENDEGLQATHRVMNAIGLDQIQFDRMTAQPREEQFWDQFDAIYELSESNMREELPLIVVNPADKAKIEAMLAESQQLTE
jgi:hypothetical protein